MKQAMSIVLALAFVLTGGVTCTRHEVEVKPIVIDARVRLDVFHHIAEIERKVETGEEAKPVKDKDKPNEEKKTAFLPALPAIGLGTPAYADAPAPGDKEMKEAVKRRSGRSDDVKKLKAGEKVGENRSGYLGVLPKVQLTKEQLKIVDEENADRKIIYRATAAAKNIPAAAVEQISGEYHRRHAAVGTWVEVPVGETWEWQRKK